MYDLSLGDIGAAADAYADFYLGGRGAVEVVDRTIALLEAAIRATDQLPQKKLAVARANLKLVRDALAADPVAVNIMTARGRP